MDLYCVPSLTQPPGPCGTHRRCLALRRLGAAGATREVRQGPRGPRSPRRLVCGGRTRPVEQRRRFSVGMVLAYLPLQSHPHSNASTTLA